MRIKLTGGGSFYGPHGVMESYGPNSTIDVDNGDKAAVAFWMARVDSGAAELIDAPPAGAAKAADKAAAAAETKAAGDAAQAAAPPMSGPGSSRDAWADYAAGQGVKVTDDMSRDDIVEAIEGKS